MHIVVVSIYTIDVNTLVRWTYFGVHEIYGIQMERICRLHNQMTVINTMEILTNLCAEMSRCNTDRQRLSDISRFFSVCLNTSKILKTIFIPIFRGRYWFISTIWCKRIHLVCLDIAEVNAYIDKCHFYYE